MDRAVERIVRAVTTGERVVFACDHDMDGTGSAAVLWCAFTEYFGVPRDRVHVVTSHRLTEGYGVTEPVVQRILNLKPTLVITADKGSSDEERIAVLASSGIDVIVTDHHEIPSGGPPQSAYAVVNPTRPDSSYDPHICGAGVAFLTMAKVRTALVSAGWRSQIASLGGLLDLVAVATIADCVSLLPTTSHANRVFVKRGLDLINQRRRPCWTVFSEDLQGVVDAEDVAFRLAPAIAAAGRLDWAESGFRFLISSTAQEAAQYWRVLQEENELRKQIERDLRRQALAIASNIERNSLVIYLEEGHPGVHGITASRLVEAFGKPAAIFSPKGAGARAGKNGAAGPGAVENIRLASGSFRGVPGLDVRRAIEQVSSRHPDLVISFGGHPAAAGATIAIPDVEKFALAYEAAVVEQLGSERLRPVIWNDGTLAPDVHNLVGLDALRAFGPFGRGFERPSYEGSFEILESRVLSKGAHLRLSLKHGHTVVPAIWFGAADAVDVHAVRPGSKTRIVYQLADNTFRGQRSFQLSVRYGTITPR